MEFEAARACGFFARATELLPREDRRSMVAAEIMGSVYHGLLLKIERDRFRVFEKEYRLNKIDKLGRVLLQLLKSI
jgi:phytoene synthase